ncbi:hypothetical protein O3P69_001223 [Scylla paramamosain]|uniref:Uncharacterized protein n=1 Tax=Scylla paramamosain TaxID=85552 RepID=A0AAW0UPA9_SCYPA
MIPSFAMRTVSTLNTPVGKLVARKRPNVSHNLNQLLVDFRVQQYMELFLQGMMAQQHLPLEAMEVEYDSDDTEVIDITLEGNEDDEGEEEEEGSITPSIYELDIEDVTSPQLGRRRRTTAAVAAATVAATTAASVHQPGNSEGEEADEEGSRSPIIQELSFEDVRIPQFGRRTPPPVEAAAQQQDSREGSQMENTGNPEIRRPATVQDADLEEEQQEIQGLQGLHSEQQQQRNHHSLRSHSMHRPPLKGFTVHTPHLPLLLCATR